MQKEAEALKENQIELQALQIEETASSKLLDNFMARSEEIKAQSDFTRPDVRIVSLADVPSEPAGSKKTILFVAIAMLSGLFAVGAALALEMIDHGIQKRDDVKKFLNIKLIGCLTQEKSPITSVL